MSCQNTFFSNLVAFIPDEQLYHITPTSSTGWYILYPPVTFNRSNTPIPIYHISGTTQYLDWSTNVPLNCSGNTNYPTGKCELIFTRVEESPNIWLKEGYSTTTKTEILLTGRTTKPKVSTNISTYSEVYCLYTNGQIRNPTFLDIVEWNLGHISFRQITGQVLVSEKVFGTPITADLRTIGRYRSILESYGLKNQLDESGLNMPEVIES
jgi:hypothetical protein